MKCGSKIVSFALAVLFLFSACSLACCAAAETDYTIVDPYAEVDWDTWQQYKANLHTHSTFSDGEFTLPVMVARCLLLSVAAPKSPFVKRSGGVHWSFATSINASR